MANPPTATVAEVETRLRAGDPTVTADDLLLAEAAERFARARAAAEDRAAADRAEAERRQRIAACRAALPARLDPAPIERARAKLAAAVDALLAACVAHDDRLRDAAEELRGLGPLPTGLSVDAPYYGLIADGGATYGLARPQTAIRAVVAPAIARRYPRHRIQLDNPQD